MQQLPNELSKDCGNIGIQSYTIINQCNVAKPWDAQKFIFKKLKIKYQGL